MLWLPCLILILTGAVGLTASVVDLRCGRIPNKLTYPSALVGILGWLVIGMFIQSSTGWTSMSSALFALLIGFVPLTICCLSLGMIGMGDAKLAGALGALLGSWQCMCNALIYALLLSMLLAVLALICRRQLRAVLVNLLWSLLHILGRQKPVLAETGASVPLAIPLSLGALLAGIEYMLQIEYPWSWLTLHANPPWVL